MITSRAIFRSLIPASALLASPVMAAEQAPPAVAMWKVADEDTTIYLMGTVHVLPPETNWRDARIDAALAAADELVTEVKGTELDAASTAQLTIKLGLLPEGVALRSLMSESQRASFDAALTGFGMNVAALDRMEPWLAALTLSILPLLDAGYAQQHGVERVLESGLSPADRHTALETVEGQLALFDMLPQDDQLRFLELTIANLGTAKVKLDDMVAAWRRGDANALADMMNEGMAGTGLEDRILYARNRAWAAWIDERLDEPGTVFMAVGAGHLAGKNSVQDYLEGNGLTVTRVQ